MKLDSQIPHDEMLYIIRFSRLPGQFYSIPVVEPIWSTSFRVRNSDTEIVKGVPTVIIHDVHIDPSFYWRLKKLNQVLASVISS